MVRLRKRERKKTPANAGIPRRKDRDGRLPDRIIAAVVTEKAGNSNQEVAHESCRLQRGGGSVSWRKRSGPERRLEKENVGRSTIEGSTEDSRGSRRNTAVGHLKGRRELSFKVYRKRVNIAGEVGAPVEQKKK